MKRLLLLIICIIFPLGLLAQQQQTEYNRKGDDAMKRQNYSDAKIWYEEGVSQCDSYSINQLTKIWLKNERMRPSMRSLMNKCLNCLNVMATENDTTAISKLIVFYENGIGTPKSEELATYWHERLETMRIPVISATNEQALKKKNISRERMKFFFGYSYSIESPYGLTVGGVARRLGWYVRFKTNMSFKDHASECNNNGLIGSIIDYYSFTNKKKVNNYAGTAGMVVKCTPWLYTTVGLGYGDRSVLYEYQVKNEFTGADEQKAWAKNIDASYKGIAADLDFMIKFNHVFISAGCNTINFKYIDLNAGLGFFF
ncbi:hypothetical protein [Parabacteroides chinchillae]|uniref:Outer membrane protein beta-barrel domain-containing protein n=1 Tax=Parabacteroides chinchillae TaxID=871327 RepID=A0A8G2BUG4_9BACT|nr:hypothetical protein [Parabacteroides chinchillae]SEF55032.1 hypothetical protein SAMN05444001_102205 [Parabacteroides chinchillae]